MKGKAFWIGGVLVLLLAVGVTMALAEGADPDYYACVNNDSGTIKVFLEKPVCKTNEIPVSWNAVGPQGATGGTGAVGATGPQGPAGPAGADGAPGDSVVAGQHCPIGEYIVGFNADGMIICQIPLICISSDEVCDGIDSDCDGIIDNNLTPPPCDNQVGVCGGSTKTCGGTTGWLACDASNYPSTYEVTETTCDSLDNDCDGSVDEGCSSPISCTTDSDCSFMMWCDLITNSCSVRRLVGDYCEANNQCESGSCDPNIRACVN